MGLSIEEELQKEKYKSHRLELALDAATYLPIYVGVHDKEVTDEVSYRKGWNACVKRVLDNIDCGVLHDDDWTTDDEEILKWLDLNGRKKYKW